MKVGVRGSRNEPNKPSKVSGSIKGLVVKRRELKKKKKEIDSDGMLSHPDSAAKPARSPRFPSRYLTIERSTGYTL